MVPLNLHRNGSDSYINTESFFYVSLKPKLGFTDINALEIPFPFGCPVIQISESIVKFNYNILACERPKYYAIVCVCVCVCMGGGEEGGNGIKI
jgi:hypothetical protein